MPPSSTRQGPGARDRRARVWLQIRPPVRRSPAACVLPVVLAGLSAAPTAAAAREIFLTRTEPAAADDDVSSPTGSSGQQPVDPETPADTDPATGPTDAPAPTPAAAPEPVVPRESEAAGPRLGAGGEIRVFGGMHQPTFGFALAFDWAFRRAALGFEVDYAAWLSLDQLGMHPGALHIAGFGLHRIPLGRLSLRQRLALGPAILLADFGAHKTGTTGLFFEAAPLGLEVHTRLTRLTFVLDAFSLALSAPALGPELASQFQYRATVGLRF